MMLRWMCTLFLVMAVLVQFSFAQEPQQYSLNGNGARAAGMGYAFTGLADDATAISWNSAGLTQLYSPEASVVFRFGFGSTTVDIPGVDVDVTQGSKFQINFASLAFPFSAGDLNVVGGIAYRRIFDFTSDFEIMASANGFTSKIILDNTGGIDAVTPALGVQFNEMFSVGIAGNILLGSTDFTEEEYFNDMLDFSSEYSEEYSGFALEIGALVKPSPQFQIGANFGLPNTITINEMEEGFEDFEYELEVPFFFSIGLAFRASDNLTLAADYRSRPWSSAKLTYEGASEEFDFAEEDANSFHVGLEYLAHAGDNVMPLRLGFYTNPTPAIDVNEDQIAFNAITGGIGLVMNQLILDAALEYVFGSYVPFTEGGEDVEFTTSDFRVSVGGTIHFGKN